MGKFVRALPNFFSICASSVVESCTARIAVGSTATLALLHECTLRSVVVFLICYYNLPVRFAFGIFMVECSPLNVLEEDDHLKLRALCCYMTNSNQSPIWLYF
jgi:hypothetical protein